MKLYRSNSILSFSITVKGIDKRIRFIPDSSGSYLSVYDEDTQKAIEESPWFGDKIYIDDINSDKPKKVIRSKPNINKVEGINNCADAQEYLVAKGVSINELQTKDDIISKAKDMGIVFTELG